MEIIQKMPQFPLSVFLLPGEKFALHIFEQRYQQLLSTIEEKQEHFGIPFVRENGEMKYGCTMRLSEVKKRYASGESDIIVECVGLYKVVEFFPKDSEYLFPSANVIELQQYKSWKASEELQNEWSVFQETALPPSLPHITNPLQMMAALGLNFEEKYNFILMADREKQEQKVLQLAKYQRLIQDQVAQVNRGFFPN